jgi:hypothetical protein
MEKKKILYGNTSFCVDDTSPFLSEYMLNLTFFLCSTLQHLLFLLKVHKMNT